jgi:hypothetical protein
MTSVLHFESIFALSHLSAVTLQPPWHHWHSQLVVSLRHVGLGGPVGPRTSSAVASTNVAVTAALK